MVQMDYSNMSYDTQHPPSAAGIVGGLFMKAVDVSAYSSNKVLRSAAGVEFVGDTDAEWIEALRFANTQETATSEERFPRNTMVNILISLLWIFLVLPLLVAFRDANTTGGVYVLAAIASVFQLTGLGRSVFLTALVVLFYCWVFTISLRSPNNEMLSFFEAIKFEGSIWLLQKFVGVERCNPYMGRLTKTKYLHTVNDFHALNHAQKFHVNLDWLVSWREIQLDGQSYFPALKVKLTYVRPGRYESWGLLITETEAGSITNDYVRPITYGRLQACLYYISLYPSNITCSNRMSSENGVPCAHAIRIKELILSLEKSPWIIQYKLSQKIAIKGKFHEEGPALQIPKAI